MGDKNPKKMKKQPKKVEKNSVTPAQAPVASAAPVKKPK